MDSSILRSRMKGTLTAQTKASETQWFLFVVLGMDPRAAIAELLPYL